jgi:hypothetical protein
LRAQGGDVAFADLGRAVGELGRELAERALAR